MGHHRKPTQCWCPSEQGTERLEEHSKTYTYTNPYNIARQSGEWWTHDITPLKGAGSGAYSVGSRNGAVSPANSNQSQVEIVLQRLLGVPVWHPGFEGLGQASLEEDQEAGQAEWGVRREYKDCDDGEQLRV